MTSMPQCSIGDAEQITRRLLECEQILWKLNVKWISVTTKRMCKQNGESIDFSALEKDFQRIVQVIWTFWSGQEIDRISFARHLRKQYVILHDTCNEKIMLQRDRWLPLTLYWKTISKSYVFQMLRNANSQRSWLSNFYCKENRKEKSNICIEWDEYDRGRCLIAESTSQLCTRSLYRSKRENEYRTTFSWVKTNRNYRLSLCLITVKTLDGENNHLNRAKSNMENNVKYQVSGRRWGDSISRLSNENLDQSIAWMKFLEEESCRVLNTVLVQRKSISSFVEEANKFTHSDWTED